jgi:monofunctional biosynthetic peptidoglycan transglycosylase
MTRRPAILTYACSRPLRFAILCAICLLAANILRYAFWPPIWTLAIANPTGTSFMDYRAENSENFTLKWTWKPLAEISKNLQKAVVVSEDSAFWDHSGFDWQGIKVAVSRNLKKGELAVGGSTLTQQLAKNLYFTPEKSLTRKAQEAIITWRLEGSLGKTRILELYLNIAEWGNGIFGAEAAARHYFKRSAASLTPRQAATLAAMLPNPHRRQPGSKTVTRISNIILKRMQIY